MTMNQQIAVTDTAPLSQVEASAREVYETTVYDAQLAWHAANNEAWTKYQDAVEDNAENYRKAVQTAQRAYRDATAASFQ